MHYNPILLPFRFHRLSDDNVVAVSESGDHVFLSQYELELLVHNPERFPLDRLADLKSKFFLGETNCPGIARLLASRIAAKKETILNGPSLHIIVPTLQCAHSCRYCQVSRSLADTGFSMSTEHIERACDSIFESPSKTLTIEFQGGDPLLKFDLVRQAIEKIANRNKTEKRNVRFVIASTLHQITDEILAFLKSHSVFLSTSIDGPMELHNRNRPLPSRDAYQRTVAGIALAKKFLGHSAVSALMTTTRESLNQPEAIVDEYVNLGFNEVFIRWLSPFGFAKRNKGSLAYPLNSFKQFYQRAFERILYWNRKGEPIREVGAAIVLNKILSPFDAGYIDLQSPSAAGIAVMVYNYDGWIYPSDEARMLAESGDTSLRLGQIGDSLETLLSSPVANHIVRSSLGRFVPGCSDCAFNPYCGPDPVSTHSQFGHMDAPVYWTDHCKRNTWLFDFIFNRLRESDQWFQNLAYAWAQPPAGVDVN